MIDLTCREHPAACRNTLTVVTENIFSYLSDLERIVLLCLKNFRSAVLRPTSPILWRLAEPESISSSICVHAELELKSQG